MKKNKKAIALFVLSIEDSRTLKYQAFAKKY